MPELVEATVRIDSYQDKCDCDDRMACYHVMRAGDISDSDDEEGSSDYARQNTTKCVVLDGLAQAKDLVLIADRPTVHSNMSSVPVDILLTVNLYVFQTKIIPADRNYIFPHSCIPTI